MESDTLDKYYFYNGFYTILNESLKLEYKIPMSGAFSVLSTVTPVAAYTSLEQSWKEYIVENYNKNNENETLDESRIMIVINTFKEIS